MYDELVKRLRKKAKAFDYDGWVETASDYEKAADAIEGLSHAVDQMTEWRKNRWIPVTERLPEKTGKYLVCGQWRGKPAETWVCELISLGKIKGWANEARNPVVTHWMPLPEPPGATDIVVGDGSSISFQEG